MTKIVEIEVLFAKAVERFGGIDIVVRNAGGGAAFKPIANATEAEYDKGMALNAKANCFVLREPAKTVCDSGRIVVIASTTTGLAFDGSSIYGGAKCAAEFHARVVAKEVGSRGITVNAVSPRLIDIEVMRAAGQVEERFAMAIRMTPHRSAMTSPTSLRSSSAKMRWITGQNLRVGSGVI